MALIRMSNASFRYPGTTKWVLRSLDFEVHNGESVRLLGRNGSGKTTILKLLCGILPLTAGAIASERNVRTAYMDQFAGEMLARDLTVAEQITMAMNDWERPAFSVRDL